MSGHNTVKIRHKADAPRAGDPTRPVAGKPARSAR